MFIAISRNRRNSISEHYSQISALRDLSAEFFTGKIIANYCPFNCFYYLYCLLDPIHPNY